MANSLPPNHADDLHELTPTMPKPVPLAPENVLFNEDKDLEEDPKEEPQEEEEFERDEFEDEMDMDFDDEMDDPKVIHPYEVEVGALPPPPIESDVPSDTEPEAAVATMGTITRLPLVIRMFSGRVFSRHGLSSIAPTADDYVEFTPGYINRDVNSLHRQVQVLTRQMETRAKKESLILKRLNDGRKFMKGLDSDVRDEVQYIHKLDRSVVTLEDHVISLEEEIEKVWVRACYGDEIPQWTDEERPKDATNVVTTLGDTQPSELRGSPFDLFMRVITISLNEYKLSLSLCCDRIMSPRSMSQAAIERLVADKVAEAIAVDHATRNGASGQGGNTGEAGGQARAPTVRE
ncbi:hypothetical protein Tco_0766661 [Tanacetum coccineum]